MSSRFLTGALVTATCLIFSGILGFNLEPRIPIVKIGNPNSHFGYSVAQHQSVLETISSKRRVTSWLLVGAPKDHNLQPGTHRSGALWKCPFTSNSSDCVQVHTDGFKDANENLLPPNVDEIKDDQWLGVTVKSQGVGGDVLVCAHRYMHRGPGFQWGFGLCYLLNQNLDMTETMEPCRGKAVAKGHEQYGFCQAGMSGLLLKDEVVLGLPGPYTWRGTVHSHNISKDFFSRDKTQYFGPVTENDSPVDKYSYLGYSVTTGYIETGERDDLVVSAPFYNTRHASGAVYVYTNGRTGIDRDTPYARIEGPAGESRFGFSMTSLGDLNRDGYLDVAIGAPYEDRGAIYIYLGSADGLVLEPSQVLGSADGLVLQPSQVLGSADGLVLEPSQVLGSADGLVLEPSQVLGSADGLVLEPSQVLGSADGLVLEPSQVLGSADGLVLEPSQVLGSADGLVLEPSQVLGSADGLVLEPSQ
ncbi:integrin alpha-PS1, partial [Hyalella azteca]|uniref:Integrin alpha-PS1 n=1 Tax=Hyalella azteca TaxID=294128 RepID=A0A8B7P556_HYAAZ